MLDPTIHAVRSDLADVRLAAQVFAPHYAAPMPRRIQAEAALRSTADGTGAVLGQVTSGETFEVLDIAGRLAWGIALGLGRVGYVPVSAIGDADA